MESIERWRDPPEPFEWDGESDAELHLLQLPVQVLS